MKSVIVSGSHRKNSQSYKVSEWLSQALSHKTGDHSAEIIDLAHDVFPLWEESAWKKESDLARSVAPHLECVEHADSIILVAPEWGGMVTAALKNFLLYISSQHTAHKPCLIVGVSSGRGGSYPVSELRMSGFKNNRMVFIPDHLIIQDVQDVMNDHDLVKGEKDDLYIKDRANYTLDVLIAYSDSLKSMRDNNNLRNKLYPFGM